MPVLLVLVNAVAVAVPRNCDSLADAVASPVTLALPMLSAGCVNDGEGETDGDAACVVELVAVPLPLVDADAAEPRGDAVGVGDADTVAVFDCPDDMDAEADTRTMKLNVPVNVIDAVTVGVDDTAAEAVRVHDRENDTESDAGCVALVDGDIVPLPVLECVAVIVTVRVLLLLIVDATVTLTLACVEALVLPALLTLVVVVVVVVGVLAALNDVVVDLLAVAVDVTVAAGESVTADDGVALILPRTEALMLLVLLALRVAVAEPVALDDADGIEVAVTVAVLVAVDDRDLVDDGILDVDRDADTDAVTDRVTAGVADGRNVGSRRSATYATPWFGFDGITVFISAPMSKLLALSLMAVIIPKASPGTALVANSSDTSVHAVPVRAKMPTVPDRNATDERRCAPTNA